MYVMYLRKSRADIEAEALGEMETLARHKKILTELSKRNGHKIGKIYQEIVSGESIQDRPEMQRLLEDVYNKKCKGVYVVEVERLARGDTGDQGRVSEAFKYSNTLIITPVKTYDPNNQYDEEYFEFGLFMSRREYKTIQRRLQTGKMMAIKEGNYMGSLPPYGYDIDKRGKNDRTLKLNDQSQYVKLIFDWFTNDRLNSGEIARRLTAMGVPTRTKKPEWNRATVKDILQNNLYCGKIRWYRRRVTKEFEEGGLAKKKRRQLAEDYLIVDGKHPAIIDQEQFDSAQKLFTGTVPIKATTTISNPFAGIMICANCGKVMRFQSYAHKKGTVRPRMVHTESSVCKVKSSFYDDVMNAVVAALKAHISDFEFKMNNLSLDDKIKEYDSIMESMTKELNKLENQRVKLFDYLESGIYTKEEFMERKGILTDRIEKLKQGMDEQEKPEQIDYKEKILTFSQVVESLKNPDVDARSKNTFIKDIISKIEYKWIGDELALDLFLR